MRYTQQVHQQLSNDLKVEFGKELGVTQPISIESTIISDQTPTVPMERSLEIARKLKKQRHQK